MVKLKSLKQRLQGALSKVYMYFRIVWWTYMPKKYINEYIIFCKNHNFKNKNNNKTTIMNCAKVIVYLVKGL